MVGWRVGTISNMIFDAFLKKINGYNKKLLPP